MFANDWGEIGRDRACDAKGGGRGVGRQVNQIRGPFLREKPRANEKRRSSARSLSGAPFGLDVYDKVSISGDGPEV